MNIIVRAETKVWIAVLLFLLIVDAGPSFAGWIWDDFEDGSYTDARPACWLPSYRTFPRYSGSVRVSEGNLILEPDAANETKIIWVIFSTDCRGGKWLRGDARIETRVRVIGEQFGYVGLRCWMGDGYVGGIDAGDDSGIFLQRYDDWVPGPLHRIECPIDENRFYKLRMEAVGSEIRLWVWPADEDGTPLPEDALHLAITDSTYTQGIAMLYHTGEGRSEFSFASVCSRDLPGDDILSRGDANTDDAIDIGDAVFILGHLFASGPPSPCQDAADANDDGKLDIADPIYVLNHLFIPGSAPPPQPFADCGPDLTPDSLGCNYYALCL